MPEADNGSASSIERTMACAGSLVLPRTSRSTVHAERGNVIHGYIRAVLAGTPIPQALAPLDAATRETCARLDFKKLGGDLRDVRCEVSYAVDPVARRARELGVNIARNYVGLGPDEVPGTNDIEGTAFDGVLELCDVKTGYESVTPCADNMQMMHQAAARMLITGADTVRVKIAYVSPNGEVDDRDRATFGRLDVDVFLDDLEAALERVRKARRVYLATGRVDTAIGAHCKYCDAMPNCGSYTSLARTMLPDLEAIDAQVGTMTPEQMGKAWTKAKAIDALLDRVLEALKAHARQAPFPTGPDTEVRANVYPRQSFHQASAIELLRTLGARDAQIAGCYRTAQVEQIKEAKVHGARSARARKPRKVA